MFEVEIFFGNRIFFSLLDIFYLWSNRSRCRKMRSLKPLAGAWAWRGGGGDGWAWSRTIFVGKIRLRFQVAGRWWGVRANIHQPKVGVTQDAGVSKYPNQGSKKWMQLLKKNSYQRANPPGGGRGSRRAGGGGTRPTRPPPTGEFVTMFVFWDSEAPVTLGPKCGDNTEKLVIYIFRENADLRVKFSTFLVINLRRRRGGSRNIRSGLTADDGMEWIKKKQQRNYLRAT